MTLVAPSPTDASLGTLLRSTREAKGTSLAEVSGEIRVSERYLRALEEGDPLPLPDLVYVRGFLALYARYLGLDPHEAQGLYRDERRLIAAPVARERPHPTESRGPVISPTTLLPVVAIVLVLVFANTLYQKLSAVTAPPKLEVTDPPGRVTVQSPDLVVRGIAAPEAKLTVAVFPRAERYTDWRASADGAFAIPIRLTTGDNRLVVEILDPQGRVASVERTVTYVLPQARPSGPVLTIDSPSNGSTVNNTAVQVSGRVSPATAAVTVNAQSVKTDSEGHFSQSLTLPAGSRTISVVAKGADGAEAQETRTVVVTYTTATVKVDVRPRAWLLVTIDGKEDIGTNRVFENVTLTYTGKTVTVRTGNAGATFVTANGKELGAMGKDGEVAEVTYRPD